MLLDEHENIVGGQSSATSSLSREIAAILKYRLTNVVIDGYGLRPKMPEAVSAASCLWRPNDWRAAAAALHGIPGATNQLGETEAQILKLQEIAQSYTRPFVTNSEKENWQDFHQSLALFWSRQTYQVDISVYDWLARVCADLTPEQNLFDVDFGDHILGKVSAFERKWRPWAGHTFAVEKSFFQRGWKRQFDDVRGRRVNKGGRPNKSTGVVNAYFERFPETHVSALVDGRKITWKMALRMIEVVVGYQLGESTFKRVVMNDPRFSEAKKRLKT